MNGADDERIAEPITTGERDAYVVSDRTCAMQSFLTIFRNCRWSLFILLTFTFGIGSRPLLWGRLPADTTGTAL